MLRLGPDSGILGSETDIKDVDSAHGEMHMPLPVSVILRRDTKCQISPTEFCGSGCQLAGDLMKWKGLEHWRRTVGLKYPFSLLSAPFPVVAEV